MRVGIYQIFYDEGTKAECSKASILYDNTWYPGKPLQPAMENHVILELIKLSRNYDYFGVLSWQFEKKNQVKIDFMKSQIETDQWTEDVITCFKQQHKNMWKMAAGWHKGIIEMTQFILRKIGYDLDLTSLAMTTVYQNAHVTRSRIYQRYVDEMLAPAMEVMFYNSHDITDKLNSDTKYRRTSVQVTSGTIARLTGHPYYTMHPFICERLFATWLSLNPEITIRHIR